MALFEMLLPEDKEYSNTIEFYDFIPKHKSTNGFLVFWLKLPYIFVWHTLSFNAIFNFERSIYYGDNEHFITGYTKIFY